MVFADSVIEIHEYMCLTIYADVRQNEVAYLRSKFTHLLLM